VNMESPREISSERQGALTPTTARVVTKAALLAAVAAADGTTPRTLDVNSSHSPWANLSVDTSLGDDDRQRVVATTTLSQPTASTSTPTISSSVPTQSNAMRTGAGATTATSRATAVQPGVLPDRYTSDLVHWQSPADLPERRLMVQRIIAMTRNKRLDPTGVANTNNVDANGVDRTPSLAKRIELSLYSRAASFHEYKDLNTLRRRLQSLVSISFHEAAVTKRAAATDSSAPTSLGKRPLKATPFGVSRLLIKRPRLSCSSSMTTAAADVTMASSDAHETFFLTNEDVLRTIFSYLPGVETIRNFTLNKYAARVLPRCVFSLDVEVKQMQTAYERASPTFLCRFANLERLNIYNEHKPCDQEETGPSLHAWGCSELDISHDNVGEEVVKSLAESIELGACRRLKSLRIVSVFTNTCRGNALHVLCGALVKGSCPDLEDLLLGGNGFSDVGTVDIAWLLKVGSLPKLTRLDVRRNYIGESGLKRIMASLAAGRCQHLKYLCMGGNIITDNSVAPVVELLSSSLCPQMRFLGLEDNFLSARGVHSIIQAAVAGGMMPKLHHVSSDGRSDESAFSHDDGTATYTHGAVPMDPTAAMMTPTAAA
jgi:hypothetical protein